MRPLTSINEVLLLGWQDLSLSVCVSVSVPPQDLSLSLLSQSPQDLPVSLSLSHYRMCLCVSASVTPADTLLVSVTVNIYCVFLHLFLPLTPFVSVCRGLVLSLCICLFCLHVFISFKTVLPLPLASLSPFILFISASCLFFLQPRFPSHFPHLPE